MGQKITLTEGDLVKLIQKIIAEDSQKGEYQEQWWKSKGKKRREKTQGIIDKNKPCDTCNDGSVPQKDSDGDCLPCPEEIGGDLSKRKVKKIEKEIKSGSINTLMNTLIAQKHFFTDATVDDARLAKGLNPKTENAEFLMLMKDKNGVMPDEDGYIKTEVPDYSKMMNELIMSKLYSMYGSIMALHFFMQSSKKCKDRQVDEDLTKYNIEKGLTYLEVLENRIKNYGKKLGGNVKVYVNDFLDDYGAVVKSWENKNKKAFNDQNIHGATGLFSDFKGNFQRQQKMVAAWEKAAALINEGDPCHWDFD